MRPDINLVESDTGQIINHSHNRAPFPRYVAHGLADFSRIHNLFLATD